MSDPLTSSLLFVANTPNDVAFWQPVVAALRTLGGEVHLLETQVSLSEAKPWLVADGPARLSWDVLDAVHARRPTVVIGTASSGALALTARARDLGLLDWPLRIIAWHDAPFALDAIRSTSFLDDPSVFDVDALHRETMARADATVAPGASAGLPEARFEGQIRVSALPRHAVAWRGLAERVMRRAPLRDPVTWPSVSICVTHFQRPALLEQALAAIWAQAYPGTLELIVVDDGSPDHDVQQALTRLEPAIIARGGTLLRQSNQYLGAARNAAVAKSHGDVLLFVDDDDCMKPGYVLAFVRALLRSDAALVSCAFDYFVGQAAPHANTPLHHRWVMLGGSPVRQIAENGFGGANFGVRRAAFDAVGGFTEDRDIGCEDWEFYHRAALAGLTHVVIPAPLLWVRTNIAGMQQSAPNAAAGAERAIRPVALAMPPAYADMPLLLQGVVRRNQQLQQRVDMLNSHRAQLTEQLRTLSTCLTSDTRVDIRQHRPTIANTSGPACYVWHDEGMGVSGILAWMWRLREQFAPAVGLDLKLVDLAVFPYRSEQAPVPSVMLYDEQIADAHEFLDFLGRTADGVHVINHCFRYLDSLLLDRDDALLRMLTLVGVCHTDQAYYYDNLERFAPYLRAIIAVSPQCAEELTRRMPAMRERIVTLPAWAVTRPQTALPTRAQGAPLRLLYTGRVIQYQKRVFDLATLAGALGARGAHVTLSIVGDGPDLEALRARIKETPGAIPVEFLPARAPWEMSPLLASHHALIQTSAFEGASVSLMEAMAFGLVPIITRTTSGHDLIEAGQNALTAPIGDIATLADAVVQLATDDATRLRMAAAARTTADTYLAALDYPAQFAAVIREAGRSTSAPDE